METPEQIAAGQLYGNLMLELRQRISAVDLCTSNKSLLSPPFVREFCFLQFRMMCELLALGCLAAHGELAGAKRNQLNKLWAADRIIEALERLHPDFYPVAITRVTTGPEHNYDHRVTPLSPQPMPKDELLKLYGRCGDVLHRGSTKKILSKKIPVQVHYPELTSIAQRFRDLLAEHYIAIRGGIQHLFFITIIGSNGEEGMALHLVETDGPWTV